MTATANAAWHRCTIGTAGASQRTCVRDPSQRTAVVAFRGGQASKIRPRWWWRWRWWRWWVLVVVVVARLPNPSFADCCWSTSHPLRHRAVGPIAVLRHAVPCKFAPETCDARWRAVQVGRALIITAECVAAPTLPITTAFGDCICCNFDFVIWSADRPANTSYIYIGAQICLCLCLCLRYAYRCYAYVRGERHASSLASEFLTIQLCFRGRPSPHGCPARSSLSKRLRDGPIVAPPGVRTCHRLSQNWCTRT